jgi:hypothetical protein
MGVHQTSNPLNLKGAGIMGSGVIKIRIIKTLIKKDFPSTQDFCGRLF